MQVNHSKNIIELKDVCYKYGNEEVLKDISFSVHQGDYLGMVGPNGAGKTTLLKIMVGLLEPCCGSIKLFGKSPKEFKDWSRIGYVPQKATNFDINFPSTVKEVVSMGRYSKIGLFKRPLTKDKEAVNKALEQVGMQEFSNRLIGDLSGGQQQRVFIARALVGQPEVIFLDEPTTGVDKESQDNFYTLLKELNEKLNLTLVLVSHDIARVTKEAMHMAYIDKTLTSYNSPEEFLQEAESLKAKVEGLKMPPKNHA